MRFLVELEVPHYRAVVVEADDADDAQDRALLGEGLIQSEDQGPVTVWTVQEERDDVQRKNS